MSNKQHSTIIILCFLSLAPSLIRASDIPHPPREALGILGKLYHEGRKRSDWYAYATDGTHSEILAYLMQASQHSSFFYIDNFLKQLTRSKKRTVRAGEQILENIDTRNTARLQRLLQQNENGLPPFLVTAATTIINPTDRNQQHNLPPPPSHKTGYALLDLTLGGVGYMSKYLDPKEYALRADTTQLAKYLEQVALTTCCADSHFATHAKRALGRMEHVHDYIQQCIQEQNPSAAKKALQHNKSFLPVAHVTCFESAIKQLQQLHHLDQARVGEESPPLDATPAGERDMVIITLNATETTTPQTTQTKPKKKKKNRKRRT